MPRYFIELCYNGNGFHGWQYQPNAITVQEVIETNLSKLLGGPTGVTGAGRTDTGVHASYYVAHFDTDRTELENSEPFIYKLNGMLPPGIAILNIKQVNSEAHARFDAVLRTYQYRIQRKKDPFRSEFSWLYSAPLNKEVMQKGAEILLNHNDFRSFSKVHTDVKTFICNIQKAEWSFSETEWIFTISADRFLRNMVRAIVGTLWELGRGKISLEDMDLIIKSGNRSNAGLSVPASGLTLTDIKYPEHVFVSLFFNFQKQFS